MIAPVQTEKKWYVYLQCDPDTEIPFYVGKGTGNRIDYHEHLWSHDTNKEKRAIIHRIHSEGKQVLKKKIAEFTNEQDAYIYEYATILVYQEHLTNIRPRGGNRSDGNRRKLSPVVNGEGYYTADEAARYLGISRPTFNKNVQPHLPEYRYGAFQRKYYRQADLDQYRGIRPVENGKDRN